MLRTTLHLAMLVLLVGSLPAQQVLRDVSVVGIRYPQPGYYFIAPLSDDSAAIIDHSGLAAYQFAERSVVNLQIQPDGSFTYYSAARVFTRRNAKFEITDTLSASGYNTDFHAVRMLRNGNYAVLGVERRIVDLSSAVSGGSSEAEVATAVIQERTLGGQVVFEWNSLDHIPVTEATEDINLRQGNIDYIHVNDIAEDSDGNLLISCRHLDEVVKINRLTGAVIWRMGGSKSKGNQFTFINDNIDGFTGFSHQHNAHWLPNGNLILFDNGELRENKFSRAVEYRVDQQAMTAERVWQYRHVPDIFSASQGSVQVLPNNSVLIGWGTSKDSIVATEVRRDGTIDAEIATQQLDVFAPYGIWKAVIGMTGVEKPVTAPGTITFSTSDSSTYVRMNVSAVTTPTAAIVERHSYFPHNIRFNDVPPCEVLPLRWVVRIRESQNVTASMTFDFSNLPSIVTPELAQLYYRPTEGTGAFAKVDGTYDDNARTYRIATAKNGEYLIGYKACFVPMLLSPEEGSHDIPFAATLTWDECVQDDGYEVQVSTSPTFTSLAFTTTTTALTATTPTPLISFNKYYWRVRGLRSTGPGRWSATGTFTTKLAPPLPLYPIAAADTVAMVSDSSFRWSSSTNAKEYRLRIARRDAPTVFILDTIVQDIRMRKYPPLAPNTFFVWNVMAIHDTFVSEVSANETFVTAPDTPELTAPANNEMSVATDSVRLSWSPVAGARLYRVRVWKSGETRSIIDETTLLPDFVLRSLALATRYEWSVTAVGRYGPGLSSAIYSFRTAAVTVLSAPGLVRPVDGSAMADTVDMTFEWTAVQRAAYYQLQIWSENMSNPDINLYGYSGTSYRLATLEPGTTYRWRVIGLNDEASGTWSEVGSFTTVPRVKQGLMPSYPPNGATGLPLYGAVKFTADERCDIYNIEFDRTGEFNAPSLFLASADTTVNYSGLSPNTLYYWRVTGLKDGQPIGHGPVFSFTTGTDEVTHTPEETANLFAWHIHVEPDGSVVSGRYEGAARDRASVVLHDVSGRLLTSTEMQPDQGFWVLRTGGISTGIYILTISGAHRVESMVVSIVR